MSTDILNLPELAENQASKYLTHNQALYRVEGLLVRCLSRSNNGPPASPSNGDVYIVDIVDGDWSTATLNDVAHYYSGAWHFYTPPEGLRMWCADEATWIYYDGSAWAYGFTAQVTLNVTLANGQAVGIVDKKTVDANATGFGAALYVASDGNLEEADASAVSTLRCMALALEAGTGADKKILRWGRIRNDTWSWTVGGLIYVSTTTGALTQTAPSGSGEFVQVVGEAEASNIIMFAPSYDAIELS
jgi:hypothetical protein